MDDATYLQAFITQPVPTGTQMWSLVAPTGQAWHLREGLVTSTLFDPATEAIRVILTLQDSSTVLLGPWTAGAFPLRTFELARLGYHGEPVVRIDGWIHSTVPIADLNLAGNFIVDTSTI